MGVRVVVFTLVVVVVTLPAWLFALGLAGALH